MKVRDFRCDGANHHADLLLLHKNVNAETTHIWQRDREVAFQVSFEFLLLLFIHQRQRQLSGNFAGQLLLTQGFHAAVRFDTGREVGRNEQIRAAGLVHDLEQLMHEVARFIGAESRRHTHLLWEK